MAGFALWNLGFRPFYLLASVFSACSVLLWAAQYSGWLPAAYLQGPLWHGHEMLFGYTMAVVAGFLLTAVRAWTGQPTPVGIPLMALAAMQKAGTATDGRAIRAALAAIDHDGVIGKIKFDRKGQANPPVYVTQWCRDGKRSILYPENMKAGCGSG